MWDLYKQKQHKNLTIYDGYFHFLNKKDKQKKLQHVVKAFDSVPARLYRQAGRVALIK